MRSRLQYVSFGIALVAVLIAILVAIWRAKGLGSIEVQLEVRSQGVSVSTNDAPLVFHEIPKPTRRATVEDLQRLVGKRAGTLVADFGWPQGVDVKIMQSYLKDQVFTTELADCHVELAFKDGKLATVKVIR